MAPPWRRDALQPEQHYRPSAVLLLLYQAGDALYFPLILRSSQLNHHASQIGLPGGALEPGESAEQAALRETEEELGISTAKIQILGSLSPLGLAVSGYTIYPVVGYHEGPLNVRPNPAEVARCIMVSLDELLHDKTIITHTLEDGRNVPAYRLAGATVWGATAMILAELTEILMQE
ncbi:NUDIX hydrolase [Gracilinema caldarium]|nr:CoA pyrophosphatase [Gracilinema caldarium]